MVWRSHDGINPFLGELICIFSMFFSRLKCGFPKIFMTEKIVLLPLRRCKVSNFKIRDLTINDGVWEIYRAEFSSFVSNYTKCFNNLFI